MKYVSTRGNAPVLGFCDALLSGLARDGGLYVPETWPILSKETIKSFKGANYTHVAKTVLWPFVEGEIQRAAFDKMVDDAYSTFHHKTIAPLVQISPNHFVLELFHGPTMAFKDVAMQLLARLMDHVLAERGEKATIVGATSGDTGGAAIEAFRGRENTDIFILFPKGRVSPVQQRQMTTVNEANVHALAIQGNFDDCQALVKAMFNHHNFRDASRLSGVNSINWGRIMAQVVYYFTASVALGGPDEKPDFCVPTGNFGDIFAGFVAKKMGLPMGQLIVATNKNDILARTFETGRYEVTGVSATQSPSMDIQVSSNFERLLFEAFDRDANKVITAMSSLSQSGAFSIDDEAMKTLENGFKAGRCDEAQTTKTIQTVLSDCGYLLDPHTAVGVQVAEDFISKSTGNTPMVTLATAHPAKFPAAVEAATGKSPALPEWQGNLMEREERFTVLENQLDTVEEFISKNTRVMSK